MDKAVKKEPATRRRVYAVFGGLAVIGAVAILFSTVWGVGLSPDSLTYIDTARNLLAGKGFVVQSFDCRSAQSRRRRSVG